MPTKKAEKRPTITDDEVTPRLKGFLIPFNQLFVIVTQIEGIGKKANDLHHTVEIGIGDAFRSPEASKQSIPVVGIIDEGIAPNRTISRWHLFDYLGWLIF